MTLAGPGGSRKGNVVRRARGGLTLALAVLMLWACSTKPDRPNETGEPQKPLKIGVIPKGMIHEFWLAVEAGARKASETLGVEMMWEGPSVETAHDEQRRILENMIAAGAKGIVIAPTDQTALRRPVQRAVDEGVPVVVFDSNLDGEAHVSFVATDNRRGGELAGEAMSRLVAPTPGRVVMLRYTEGSGSTRQREAGFDAALVAGGGRAPLDSQFTNGTTEGAITVATNMLGRFVEGDTLELDGVFASNLPTTIGMMRALDRLRSQGIRVSVEFIGFDASEELVSALQDGQITALVVQDPYRMGYLGVETLVKHLRGEPVQGYVDTGVSLVTKEDLKDPGIRRLVGLDP